MEKVRVVHYLNQFFGQLGGEDQAGIGPQWQEGPVGAGGLIEKGSNGRFEVIRTVICGDNYAAENLESFQSEVLKTIKEAEPDCVLAGPSFFQGRHGMACAAVCLAVQKELGIPAVTAMHPLNPGVEMCRKHVYILETGKSAREMVQVLPRMLALAEKLLTGEALGLPQDEGYLPRGIRVNTRVAKRGSRRAVEMLLKKLQGHEFITELPIPVFDRVTPAPPIGDLQGALIALTTDGGVVPQGNPDKIEAHNASKWLKYPLDGVDDLQAGIYESAHGGYDPVYVNEDPDRVLPLDACRLLEAEGVFQKLYPWFFTTTGNVTAVASAARFGREMGEALLADGVQGAILTST